MPRRLGGFWWSYRVMQSSSVANVRVRLLIVLIMITISWYDGGRGGLVYAQQQYQHVLHQHQQQQDCQERINGFLDCVNTTMRDKYATNGKLESIKIHVNDCLKRSKCARLFLDATPVTRSGGGGGNANKNSRQPQQQKHLKKTARADYSQIMQCVSDYRPFVEKCVSQLVPEAAIGQSINRGENRWTILQESTNKTRIKALCEGGGARGGDFPKAVACIDRVLAANDNSTREEKEEKLTEFCATSRQCRVGMGICQTVLENSRKAYCDCVTRALREFDTVRHDVPSCAQVTDDEMIAAVKRMLHAPYLNHCGADPCDAVLTTTTDDRGGAA